MTKPEPEIQIMNDRINSLETTIMRGVEASEKVSLSVNDLLLEFRERDVRHEYEREANLRLSEKVSNLDVKLCNYIDIEAPTLARVKKSHGIIDDMWKGMSSTTGKLMIGIIIFGIMVLIGLDPRTVFKG